MNNCIDPNSHDNMIIISLYSLGSLDAIHHCSFEIGGKIEDGSEENFKYEIAGTEINFGRQYLETLQNELTDWTHHPRLCSSITYVVCRIRFLFRSYIFCTEF